MPLTEIKPNKIVVTPAENFATEGAYPKAVEKTDAQPQSQPTYQCDPSSLKKFLDTGSIAAIPPEAEADSIKLCSSFKGADHYVVVEKIKDKFYFVIRWSGAKAMQKPLILTEYDHSKIEYASDMIVIKVGGNEIKKIETNGEWQSIKYAQVKDMAKYQAALMITYASEPLSDEDETFMKEIAASYMGESDTGYYIKSFKNTDSLYFASTGNSKEYLGDEMAITVKVPKNEKLQKAKAADAESKDYYFDDTVITGKVVKKFADDVVTTSSKKGSSQSEIVFVIDKSGSMITSLQLVREAVGQIVEGMKNNGVKNIKVGVVLFYDPPPNGIKIVFPLTAMNKDAELKFKEALMNFVGGGAIEPTAEAALKGIEMLKGGSNPSKNQSIIVMTDEDGIFTDTFEKPYLCDVAKSAKKKYGINTTLYYMNNSKEDISYSPYDVDKICEIEQILNSNLDLAKKVMASPSDIKTTLKYTIENAESLFPGNEGDKAVQQLIKMGAKAKDELRSVLLKENVTSYTETIVEVSQILIDAGDNLGFAALYYSAYDKFTEILQKKYSDDYAEKFIAAIKDATESVYKYGERRDLTRLLIAICIGKKISTISSTAIKLKELKSKHGAGIIKDLLKISNKITDPGKIDKFIPKTAEGISGGEMK